jgi:hypothetical protein
MLDAQGFQPTGMAFPSSTIEWVLQRPISVEPVATPDDHRQGQVSFFAKLDEGAVCFFRIRIRFARTGV